MKTTTNLPTKKERALLSFAGQLEWAQKKVERWVAELAETEPRAVAYKISWSNDSLLRAVEVDLLTQLVKHLQDDSIDFDEIVSRWVEHALRASGELNPSTSDASNLMARNNARVAGKIARDLKSYQG